MALDEGRADRRLAVLRDAPVGRLLEICDRVVRREGSGRKRE